MKLKALISGQVFIRNGWLYAPIPPETEGAFDPERKLGLYEPDEYGRVIWTPSKNKVQLTASVLKTQCT
jgi:hypothetical protein